MQFESTLIRRLQTTITKTPYLEQKYPGRVIHVVNICSNCYSKINQEILLPLGNVLREMNLLVALWSEIESKRWVGISSCPTRKAGIVSISISHRSNVHISRKQKKLKSLCRNTNIFCLNVQIKFRIFWARPWIHAFIYNYGRFYFVRIICACFEMGLTWLRIWSCFIWVLFYSNPNTLLVSQDYIWILYQYFTYSFTIDSEVW